MNRSGSSAARNDSAPVTESLWRERTSESLAQTRNGADLAVDPTLAGSWAPKGTWRPGVSMPVPRSSCERSRSASSARRSRRRRFRRGPKSIARTDALPPAVPRPISSTWASNGFRIARRLHEILGTRPANPAFPMLRPCGFNGLGVGLHQGEPLCVPLLIPPPRGISPSRRSGSKIPSSSPAFQPLPRKGQSPFRCLEGAAGGRFGQARDRPVIHFSALCQWTRLDNSTARRERGGFIPCRVARAA